MYEEGKGLPKDLLKARDVYARGCGHVGGGGPEACVALARLQLSGKIGKADRGAAVATLRRGCDPMQRVQVACEELRKMEAPNGATSTSVAPATP